MKKFLKPIFYDEFSCVADKCRNTCCAGWNIYVDDAIAEKYEKNNIKLNDKQCMILDEEGRCTCLREDGLCGLVCKYGESFLSYTCDFYPRTARENDDYIELYLNNSCQAVLEFLMKDHGHLIFTVCETYDREIIYDKTYNEINFLLRDFIIDLLQIESSSIWTRLFMAYNFIRHNNENNIDDINNEIKKYSEASYFFGLIDAIDRIKLDVPALIRQKAYMAKRINGSLDKGIVFKKYIKKILEFIEIADVDDLVNDWVVFSKEMKKYDYFYENYAVNSIYKTLIPSKNEEKLVSNAEIIMLEIAMSYFTCFIWWHLNHKKITEEEIIDISGYYAKIMEHNKVLCNEFIDDLKKDGELSTAVIYMLLGI